MVAGGPTRWQVPARRRALLALVVATALVAGLATPGAASEGTDLVRTILQSSKRADRADAARELAALLEPGPIRKVAKKADTNDRAADALELIANALIGDVSARKSTKKTRLRAIACLGVVDLEVSAEHLALVAIDDAKKKLRAAAASALGKLDESSPLVVDTLLEASVASFGDERRQGFIEAAVAAIGDGAVEPLVAVLPTADGDTQIRVIDLLKSIEAEDPDAVVAAWPPVVEALIAELSTLDGFNAGGLLARIGEPAVGRLIEIARRTVPTTADSNPAEDPRANAEFALIEMARTDRAAIAPLLAALDSRDLALIADLMNFYIQLGEPGSEEVLIEALNAETDMDRAVSIALEFVNSGHPPLDAAGRSWASDHGFSITGQPSGQVIWGNLGGDPNT